MLGEAAKPHYVLGMSSTRNPKPASSTEEVAEQRRSRLAQEAKLIEEARRQQLRGEVVDFEAVEAWIKSWDTPEELPKPKPALGEK